VTGRNGAINKCHGARFQGLECRVISLPGSFPHVYALRMTSPRYFVLFWLALMVSVANVSAQSTSTHRVEASAQTHDFSSLGWADSFQHLQQTMSPEHASSLGATNRCLTLSSACVLPLKDCHENNFPFRRPKFFVDR
jgi:hypothetical protein